MEESMEFKAKKGCEAEQVQGSFNFLDDTIAWKKEWQDMPEFVQEDLRPWKQVIVSFENRAAMEAFGKLIDQKITFETPSVWFPKAEIGVVSDKKWVQDE